MPVRRRATCSTLTAGDIMRKRLVTVSPFLTLRQLSRLFITRRISGAPVVDRAGKLIGVVSQTDLVRHERTARPPAHVPEYYLDMRDGVYLKETHLDASDYTRVREVMTPVVFMTEETTPIRAVARFMLRKRVHRIIVTRRGIPRGIMTSMDLLRALLNTPNASSR